MFYLGNRKNTVTLEYERYMRTKAHTAILRS